MIVDLHTHLVASSADSARAKLNVWNRVLIRIAGFGSASDCRERFVRELREGPVEKAVVCAIEGSPLAAGNREVVAFCQANPGFLYGANLNPLSPAIEEEMDAAVSDGAVLLKLMPSFQGVDPASPQCDRYWTAAALPPRSSVAPSATVIAVDAGSDAPAASASVPPLTTVGCA